MDCCHCKISLNSEVTYIADNATQHFTNLNIHMLLHAVIYINVFGYLTAKIASAAAGSNISCAAWGTSCRTIIIFLLENTCNAKSIEV